MCGRYCLATPAAIVAEVFEIAEVPDLTPRYNIAPTQQVAIVRTGGDGGRHLGMVHWGLVPFWASTRELGGRMINARSETAAEKPAFRSAFRSRRCLVVADGFYEWRRDGRRKQPYHVRYLDGRPFGFAGLWERWDRGEGEPLESCAILTCSPNDVVAPLHDRMPAIVAPEHRAEWLEAANRDVAALESVLRPASSSEMEAFPVSLLVNNPANDVAACREPLSNETR